MSNNIPDMENLCRILDMAAKHGITTAELWSLANSHHERGGGISDFCHGVAGVIYILRRREIGS